MKITINKFKKVEFAEVELGPVNVFIGANNSGKSSFIQAVQFAVSGCQTLQLKHVSWRNKERKLALDSTDFLYTPTRFIENLYNGQKLTGSRTRGTRKSMVFKFDDGVNSSKIDISKGKNGGFTTTLTGIKLGDELSSIENPFCVYVPGIAGIPIQEKYEVPIAIKKSAARGDSNNFLRNIILDISLIPVKWSRFTQSVNLIYPNIIITATFDRHSSEFIEVTVENSGSRLPIDSVGTGLLQIIQVFVYIEYFDPKIILLDEPDAHIHPTKQKLLAAELLKRARENDDLRVVFSTHSRYILEALEDHAKVFHFHDGIAIPDVKGSKILLDIGAADADYLFSKKDLKYVIVTEDKVDNIAEKKEYLKKFALANGLHEDEFVLHSYEGCTKVDFAKILQGFVAKQIPTVKMLVHFDRDQRFGEDPELIKLKADCEKRDLSLFITEFSELENYFCTPEQISAAYNLDITDARLIYNQILGELEVETKRKLANAIVQSRPEFSKNKEGKFDIETLNQNTDLIYQANKVFITPGKEFLGKIKYYVQTTLRLDPQRILDVTPALTNDKLQSILHPDKE